MADLPDSEFSRLVERARRAVRREVKRLLEDAQGRETQQAVVLGAVAGAVESFVCAADEGVSRDRLKNALSDVVIDFVDQVKDQLAGGLQ